MSTEASHFPQHPLGASAHVLFVSPFGPYAQDDQYGSRAINPMELYHNQVTRVQHAFSFRSFHRSWGLMLIQVNLATPCTVLDFPSEVRFVEELKTQRYDVIGIGSIIPNLLKVRRMCRLIRKYQPAATIVIGGHITNTPELEKWVDADYVAKGDGVRWMRRFFGEDEERPIQHPQVLTNLHNRIMGVPLGFPPGLDNATLVPGVGCPKSCNFCSTSAMFGGKGKFIEFFKTGQELFEIMCHLEKNLGVKGFFVMDENFLLNRQRALDLLDLTEKHHKSWFLHIFSSADTLRRYSMEQLVSLGITWVWMGLEGKDSQYSKLGSTDTIGLVHTLQSHGIRVLGSSIIGLENHSPENINEVISHAVQHCTELHQFMLYTPIPGTLLYAELEAADQLLAVSQVPLPDIHGQLKFNYRHPFIKNEQETEFLLRAFRQDFEVNGPSVVRIIRTLLRGWKRHRNHRKPHVRARFAYEALSLPTDYAGALWASRQRFREDPHRYQLISEVLEELHGEFGRKSRRAAPIIGRYLFEKLQEEELRLKNGWTYEPPTYYETNSPHGPKGAKLVTGIRPTAT